MEAKYFIMDSCCFIDTLTNRHLPFDYNKINEYIKKNKMKLVISPYTLYELIQKLSKVEDISNLRKQLIDFGEFWVQNINQIFNYDGFEYGIDFIFLLKMHSDETLIEFDYKRRELREIVYKSLFKKMYLYSQMVAIITITMEDYLKNGIITKDTIYKKIYIDEFFFKHFHERYDAIFTDFYNTCNGLPNYDLCRHEFGKNADARLLLREQVIELIIEIIVASDIELSLIKKEWVYLPGEYDHKMIEGISKKKEYINASYFGKLYSTYHKKTGKSISPIINNLLVNCPQLHQICFHDIIIKLFNSGGFGDKLNNGNL